MEQLSLFNAPQLLMGDFYRAIEQGNWAAIPGIIQSIEKLRIKLPHWRERVVFWEEYGTAFKNLENQSPVQIALFWETLEPVLCEKGLQAEKNHLEKYWFSRIVEKLESKPVQYLTPKLHPAYCHLQMGNYPEVVHVVNQYVNDSSEDSLLRTYQSFALKQLGKDETAQTCLVFALFYNPLRTDIRYVFDTNLQQLFHNLESELTAEKELRSVWPFEGWVNRIVEIPGSRIFATKIESLYAGDILAHDSSDTVDKQIHFNHLLYVSEVERKNATLISDEIIRIRTRMKTVNPAAFERYIDRIR